MTGFNKYFHLEAFGKDDVKGITQGTIFIQCKLDGSSGSIFLGKDGAIRCGSRNRVLSLQEDNQGFCAFVEANKATYEPFFTLLPNAVLFGEWLCLSGDTMIRKTSAGKNSQYMSIRDMYSFLTEEKTEKIYYKTKIGEKVSVANRESWWKRYGFPSIFSLYHDEDVIKPNKIKNIVFTGIKEVFEIKTRKGFTIKASKNHPFLTPNGYVSLENLKINDCVAVTSFLTNRKKRTYGQGTNQIQLSQKQYKLDVARCEKCGSINSLELHHKDGNHLNNEIDNFLCLCRDCHIKQHKSDKKFTGFIYDYEFDKIISISYIGEEDCYDISMEGDESTANFVANGFIVHNCRHTISYYDKDAYKKFYVFDVALQRGEELSLLTPEQYEPVLDSLGILHVPTVAKLENYEGDFSEFKDKVRFLISGDGQAEGLVIKNYNFTNIYGRKTFAKIVFPSFKEEKKVVATRDSTVESDIAEKFVTEHLVEKEYAKIATTGAIEGIQARLLNTVFKTMLEEEIWDILKKFKNPIIDFKALQRSVYAKIKELKEELF